MHRIITLRRLAALGAAGAASLAFAGTAFAAGVDPAVVSQSANPGSTITINKVVHTPAIPPKPDIVLAVDNTGSMGGSIANVQANLHAIVSNVTSSEPTAQFAVTSYKDTGDGAGLFQVRQALTGTESDVQAGVDAMSASGGGDTPEAWINALWQISAGGAIAFRPDSSRIVVLVGDASSHDPVNGHSLADAITGLQGIDAKVVAIPVSDGSSDGGLDGAGQASAVVAASGGQLVGGGPSDVTNAILTGLHNLPVKVTPQATCDTGLSATWDKGDVTVTSGDDASYVETVTIAPDATQGATLHCTVHFLLNGSDAGSAFTETVNVTVNDTTPPVVTVTGQTVEATSPAGAVINYPASAVDNVDGALTPTCVPPAGSTFALGATTVTCSATDKAGNTGTATAVMHVVDTTPPTAGCVQGPNPDGTTPPPTEDGFYRLTAKDIVDTTPKIYIRDTGSSAVFGPYANGTTIKLIQAPGATPSVKPGTGAVKWWVTLKGDALITAKDSSGNTSAVAKCLVPPPPK